MFSFPTATKLNFTPPPEVSFLLNCSLFLVLYVFVLLFKMAFRKLGCLRHKVKSLFSWTQSIQQVPVFGLQKQYKAGYIINAGIFVASR
jgi:hypothetical protein